MSVMNVALAQSGLGDYIFGLDPQLIFDSLITLLAMFVLFLFLSYLLFNPARDLMQKRQETIRQEMETAAKEKADAIANRLVGLGIRAIWNFAHVDLELIDKNVVVENVHLSDSLMQLSYNIVRNKKAEENGN